MDISKQEKMKVLLEQIEISEEDVEQYFQGSLLSKLEVYKQSKTWHFHIQTKHVLPVHMYNLMTTKLQTAFQKIAKIDLTLYTEEDKYEDEIICAHWHNFLQSISNLSPAYKDLVHSQTPTIEHNNLIITARNDAEASALKKRLEDAFKNYCKKIGAQSYTIVIEVKTIAADIEKFRAEKALEDQQIALKTVQE